MIWILTIAGAVVVGLISALIVGEFFSSKLLGGLVGTMVLALVLFGAAAFASATAPTSVMGFSHAQLEADRIMTQEMSVSTDPGMEALMAQQNSMLQRSSNPAYVQALEEHVRQFDRMLGEVP